MASVSTYLNFPRNTEEAFNFYREVFGGDFEGGIQRMGDVPPQEGMPPVPDEDKNLVMHVGLQILGGHWLMGTDAPESMGFHITPGNNVYINLNPDSRPEADRLFQALSANGKVEMEMAEQFWGDYFGSCVDRFGIQWMVNTSSKE